MKRVVLCLLTVLLTASVASAQCKLLVFHSQWCGPCQAMEPTIQALSQAGYAVEEVDIDRDPMLAKQFGVTSIPCFVAVENGQEVDRAVGATSYERLESMVRVRPAGVAVDVKLRGKAPTPAWRYVAPKKHHAAVVRIYCQDDVRTRSIGSGTLVRWNGRIVVLTARHVVKDAKSIVVELWDKKTYRARVLKTDPTWDVAVLELCGRPERVVAVDVELGDAAMQKAGNRLESCGYGPDGKLASNSGLFIGYRRSSQAINGPDDWMVISGHARQGDSGGPVFNERGHLVGVLWGTDGETVVCAGRQVAPGAGQRRQAHGLHAVATHASTDAAQRYLSHAGTGCGIRRQRLGSDDPWLPWRKEQEARNRQMQERLGSLDQKLDVLIQRKEQQPQVPQPSSPPPAQSAEGDQAPVGPQTAAGRIAQRGADWLAEHGGPLSSRLAAGASERLDSDSPGVRLVGWTQAKAAWAVFLGIIVLLVGLGIWLLHRLNNRLLPILQAKAAATPNKIDDALVGGLTFLHNRVDNIEQRIANRIGGASAAPASSTVPASTAPATIKT